jgi:hypothetical protein
MKDPAFKRLYVSSPRVRFATVRSVTRRATPEAMRQTIEYRASEDLKGRGPARQTLNVDFVMTEDSTAPALHKRVAGKGGVPASGHNKAFIFLDGAGKVRAVYQYSAARMQRREGSDRNGGFIRQAE